MSDDGYQLRFTKEAQKELRKMDKHQAKLITRWLYVNVDGIDDPYRIGKGLTADKSGQWRYRIGNYRVICEIDDDQLIVLAINIGHRRSIYK
ncbi:type II toxin-antitoxin system RelE family toxin [Lentilactobacillus senioris]|uniref:type II toxin-antitoxin system RelE family toxin n=1 Tax=Lentilactobacillus senioris TaxID=931534 RepID=UPI00227E700E|nr:type II toxin-antitoxin system RelE/ParE family toxin [Lentilactobacillus senioris]MCY9807027.1 type II toxin-antitoxin system RelE/ParE family toxin [Lentilactobacillus senioris]